MELYEILLACVVGILMVTLVVYSCVKYKVGHKDYEQQKRREKIISRRQVLKDIKNAKEGGRSGEVFDGQIDDQLKKELQEAGNEVEEYTDYRGYPCVRVWFKE